MSESYLKFRNHPNYSTASRKFDCSHLDKFLEKNQVNGYTKTIQSQTPNVLHSASVEVYKAGLGTTCKIRPSTAFSSQGRPPTSS